MHSSVMSSWRYHLLSGTWDEAAPPNEQIEQVLGVMAASGPSATLF